MDQECFLFPIEGVYGDEEDYQVLLPDGQAVGQLLWLGQADPAAGGKRSNRGLRIKACFYLLALKRKSVSAKSVTTASIRTVGPSSKWQSGAQAKYGQKFHFTVCCHQVC